MNTRLHYFHGKNNYVVCDLPVIWFITMTIIGYQNGATRFQRIVKPLKQIFFVFDMQNCITTIGETL